MGVAANVLRRSLAGVAATAAMDLLWYRRYRAAGGDKGLVSWELTSDATSFDDDAPAPARVGKRVADLVGVPLGAGAVGPLNDVVHWMTGLGWGQAAGIAAGALRVPALGVGVATGVTAWGTSYAVLGRLGIYEPITHYDRATLWKDLSAHLVFGATLGAVLRATGPGRH